MSFKWVLLTPPTTILDTVLLSTASSTRRLVISSSFMFPGQTYTFSLNVSNFLGFTASQTAAFQVSLGSLPTVSIPSKYQIEALGQTIKEISYISFAFLRFKSSYEIMKYKCSIFSHMFNFCRCKRYNKLVSCRFFVIVC